MRDIIFSDLDLLCLNIFVHLYENQSATFVSQKLNIPAPKISRSLKHAREIFGNELFIRKRYGLIPNEYASKIYPVAKEIVECSKALQSFKNESVECNNLHFNIAIPTPLYRNLSKGILNNIRDAGKQISVSSKSWSPKTLDEISKGKVDIGLCYSKNNTELHAVSNICTIALSPLNRLLLIANEHHDIYHQEITLETIAKHPFANPNIGGIKNAVSPFQEYCNITGLTLHSDVEAKNINFLFDYLRNSQALTLLPFNEKSEITENIDGLHSCELSQFETNRIYSRIAPPMLTLVYNSCDNGQPLQWMINSIIDSYHQSSSQALPSIAELSLAQSPAAVGGSSDGV